MSEELHTPSVIDLEAILRPISEESESGESLRYSGLYGEIVEARRQDDNLNQGAWQTELKVADYHKVIQLAIPALTNQSKDLQVAVWLSESLTRVHGFAGLRDSLRLISGLQERFWDSLFPIIDEGDMEGRANAISWFDSQCSAAAKTCPITAGSGFGYNDLLDAKKFDFPSNIESLDYDSQQRFNQLRQQAETEGRTTAEMWKSAVSQTRRSFVESVDAAIEECWAAYNDLNRVIDEKFDRNQMPGTSELKKTLDDIQTQVKKILDRKRLEEPDPADADLPAETTVDEDGTVTVVATSGGGGGPVSSRPEALKRLAEIAVFFQKTEPHSPVSYLVQRAVKWGNMPLDTWLQEVIKDTTVLEQLKEMLGVVPAPPDQGTSEPVASAPATSDW